MHSQLKLQLEPRRGQTIVKDAFVTAPLKLMALPQHHSSNALDLMHMSASPGLFHSDQQDIHITLAEHSRANIHTQAYQRVYARPSNGSDAYAKQNTEIHLHPNSRLCYLPHPLVLHKNAALNIENRITLEPNCQLFWSEIISGGRTHSGESFEFDKLHSKTQIYWQNRCIARDIMHWQPAVRAINTPTQMAEFSHHATVWFANTGSDFTAKKWVDLIHAHLEPKLETFGVTQAHPNLIVLRMLHTHGDALYQYVKELSKLLA
jgi:urease accessory protein